MCDRPGSSDSLVLLTWSCEVSCRDADPSRAIYKRLIDRSKDNENIQAGSSEFEGSSFEGGDELTLWGSIRSRTRRLWPKERSDSASTHSQETEQHWTHGLFICSLIYTALFVTNLVFIATAIGLSRGFHDGGFLDGYVFYQGSCSLTKAWSRALSLIINIFSTAMLGISSYCMQIITAPTRADIDKHHAKRKWLDIGCLTWRNIRALDRRRLAFFLVMFVTTTPFHLT